jgi:ABC-type transporter Mla subunit MlaD
MSDERAQLEAAVDRLEAITARLAAGDVAQEELKRLAEGALAASATVTELLPRIIRQIERASEGDVEIYRET